MLRRFVCLTALLLLLLSAGACSDSKDSVKKPAVPDPEGAAKPSLQKPG